MSKQPDVTVQNEGTVFLFHLHTERARTWCEDNCVESYNWAGAVVVEHRYARDLTQGMLNDGLKVV